MWMRLTERMRELGEVLHVEKRYIAMQYVKVGTRQ